jgi:sec-independent protein translocase protein TatA
VPLPGIGKKPYRMLSIPDMAILGAAALMLFGPDQLPKVAKKVGLFMRDVQNTSQDFLREMERAADDHPYDPGTGEVATAHEFSSASLNGAGHDASDGSPSNDAPKRSDFHQLPP